MSSTRERTVTSERCPICGNPRHTYAHGIIPALPAERDEPVTAAGHCVHCFQQGFDTGADAVWDGMVPSPTEAEVRQYHLDADDPDNARLNWEEYRAHKRIEREAATHPSVEALVKAWDAHRKAEHGPFGSDYEGCDAGCAAGILARLSPPTDTGAHPFTGSCCDKPLADHDYASVEWVGLQEWRGPVKSSVPDTGADDYLCPNCVTPWKCNGPHIPGPEEWPEDEAEADIAAYAAWRRDPHRVTADDLARERSGQ